MQLRHAFLTLSLLSLSTGHSMELSKESHPITGFSSSSRSLFENSIFQEGIVDLSRESEKVRERNAQRNQKQRELEKVFREVKTLSSEAEDKQDRGKALIHLYKARRKIQTQKDKDQSNNDPLKVKNLGLLLDELKEIEAHLLRSLSTMSGQDNLLSSSPSEVMKGMGESYFVPLKDVDETLKVYPSLTTLRLTQIFNPPLQYLPDEEGLNKLTQFIRGNRTITSLHLGYQSITAEEIKEIALALKENKIIKSLNLTSSNFGDLGASHLATHLLKNNTSLSALDLTSCRLTSQGIAEILENTTIESLILNDNYIGKSRRESFVRALTDNKILRFLSIQGCEIDEEDETLKQLRNKRPDLEINF